MPGTAQILLRRKKVCVKAKPHFYVMQRTCYNQHSYDHSFRYHIQPGKFKH